MSKVPLQDASGPFFKYNPHLKSSLTTTIITLSCQYTETIQKAVLLQETVQLIVMKQKPPVLKRMPCSIIGKSGIHVLFVKLPWVSPQTLYAQT